MVVSLLPCCAIRLCSNSSLPRVRYSRHARRSRYIDRSLPISDRSPDILCNMRCQLEHTVASSSSRVLTFSRSLLKGTGGLGSAADRRLAQRRLSEEPGVMGVTRDDLSKSVRAGPRRTEKGADWASSLEPTYSSIAPRNCSRCWPRRDSR